MRESEKSRPAQEVEITPSMIEAGRQALIASEALDYPSFATPSLMREILTAALNARRK